MTFFNFLFAFVMIQVFGVRDVYGFWRTSGRIKSLEGTKMGLPVVSISDGNSIRLQLYEPQTQKVFWCRQVVSIEHRLDEVYVELDTITMSCANFHMLHRVLKKNFINFGDVIYLKVEGQMVVAMFVLPSGLCTGRTYVNKHNGIKKTTQTINPVDCRRLLDIVFAESHSKTNYNALTLITPETPEGSETVGPTYLPTKVVRPPTVSSITVEEAVQPPVPADKGTRLANKQTIPPNMVDVSKESVKEDVQPTTKPEASSEPQSTLKRGSWEWPEVEDGLMELLSADGVVESSYKPLREDEDEIRRYSKGSVSITMQNRYKGFNRNEDEKCVRLLVISYAAIEMQRVVVSCGPVTGLTMTDRFIKYRRAFAIYFGTPPNANSIYNVKGEGCISRTYFVKLIARKPWYLVERIDEKTKEQLCSDLKRGSVTGIMFGTEYDDRNDGLQGNILLEINPPKRPAFKPEDAIGLALVRDPGPIVPNDSDEEKSPSEETKPNSQPSAQSETNKSPGSPTGLMAWGSSLWGKFTENKNTPKSAKS